MAKRRRARRRVGLGYSEEKHLTRVAELSHHLDFDMKEVERHLERGKCLEARVKLTTSHWVFGLLDGHVETLEEAPLFKHKAGAPMDLLKRVSGFNTRLVHLGAQFDHVCKIG